LFGNEGGRGSGLKPDMRVLKDDGEGGIFLGCQMREALFMTRYPDDRRSDLKFDIQKKEVESIREERLNVVVAYPS
jgi:hypothetical protein